MSETLPKNVEESRLQNAMNETVDRTKENSMFINPTKTYEMAIEGRPDTKDMPQIEINHYPIERVKVTKLVGVHIQSDLEWDTHEDFIISKARPKLYFLTALKKSKLTPKELLKFYLSVIRSQLEYAAPVFATSLPTTLVEKLIFPGLSYNEALKIAGIYTLQQRRLWVRSNFFKEMQIRTIFYHTFCLMNEKRTIVLDRKKYEVPKCRTSRFKNTLIPYCLLNYQ